MLNFRLIIHHKSKMRYIFFRSLFHCGRIYKPSVVELINSRQSNLNLKENFAQFNSIQVQKNFKRNFFKSIITYKKKGSNNKECDDNILDSELEKDLYGDTDYNELMNKMGGSLSGITSLAVLQPWVKWGYKKRIETSSKLLLDEACALVKSIPGIDIPYKEAIHLQAIKKNYIFGKGSLERVCREVHQSRAQAVFISVDHLTRVEKCTLEEEFQKPVLDRFFIVLSIFKYHARTTEARLQIAMAELPFMSKRYLTETERMILHERRAKLSNTLKRLEERREKVRTQRRNNFFPSVAVIGYTNCGKTTLIRALTGDEKLKGENRLFATLDVTAHHSFLPCGLKVLYLDSVGFIQDIPTSLIASFRATLQDTIYADAIVLVRDISHPDNFNQTKSVHETLDSLPLPKETPVIVANNKVDLIDKEKYDVKVEENELFTSSITGEGLRELEKIIEREILRVTDRKIYALKLPTGSFAIDWLKKNMGVSAEEYDKENPQITKLNVVMNEAEKANFRRALRNIQQKR